jgi:hypothetical protein
MRNILTTLAALTLAVTAAPKPDSYQVTGPVVEVTDTKLVVEGKNKALEDAEVQKLKEKADGAASDDEARKAQRA